MNALPGKGRKLILPPVLVARFEFRFLTSALNNVLGNSLFGAPDRQVTPYSDSKLSSTASLREPCFQTLQSPPIEIVRADIQLRHPAPPRLKDRLVCPRVSAAKEVQHSHVGDCPIGGESAAAIASLKPIAKAA